MLNEVSLPVLLSDINKHEALNVTMTADLYYPLVHIASRLYVVHAIKKES